MKYKIKIVTYNSGIKGYFAYVKKGWFWKNIHWGGEIGYSEECENRETVLEYIDKHFSKTGKKSITFEYITK